MCSNLSHNWRTFLRVIFVIFTIMLLSVTGVTRCHHHDSEGIIHICLVCSHDDDACSACNHDEDDCQLSFDNFVFNIVEDENIQSIKYSVYQINLDCIQSGCDVSLGHIADFQNISFNNTDFSQSLADIGSNKLRAPPCPIIA